MVEQHSAIGKGGTAFLVKFCIPTPLISLVLCMGNFVGLLSLVVVLKPIL